MKEAILHNGFSIIDVLQPCVTFYNTWGLLKNKIYKLEDTSYDFSNLEYVFEKAMEWDYTEEGKIAIEIFYKVTKPTYNELLLRGRKPKKFYLK